MFSCLPTIRVWSARRMCRGGWRISSPALENKLAMDSQSYYWFGALLQIWAKRRHALNSRGLNEQHLHQVRGRRLLTQFVAAGEYDLAVETNLNTVLSCPSRERRFGSPR